MSDDARNQTVIERNLLIPLKDGASLSPDLHRPAGKGPFPALMSFYPYHKDDIAARHSSRRGATSPSAAMRCVVELSTVGAG